MNNQQSSAQTGNNGCGGPGPAAPLPGSWHGSLAMVHSPEQSFDGLYSPEDALAHGTLFEDLYKPHMPNTCTGEVPS